MHNFKQGDTAICVNTGEDADCRFYGSFEGRLTLGKRYEVLGVIGDYLQIIDETGARQGWNKYRFDKLQVPTTKRDTTETTLAIHNFKQEETYTREDLRFALEMNQIGGCLDGMCAMIAVKKAFEKLKDNEDFQKFMSELSIAGNTTNLIKELVKDLK